MLINFNIAVVLFSCKIVKEKLIILPASLKNEH